MVHDAAMRTRTFKMRLSEQEWARIERLMAIYETSAAAVIRLALWMLDLASIGKSKIGKRSK